tara:strand:- start:144 stop:788 length:645 start_codon:yes stop_codon:yes gene_type:complete
MDRKAEASRLKKIWKEKAGALDLTYAKAAKVMGLGDNYSAVSHMINGRNVINLDRGLQFSEILGCNLGDFSPRLNSKLAILKDNDRVSGEEMSGDVGWLVGVEFAVAKKILSGEETTNKKIFWAGKHSNSTYALEVSSEANAPTLPNNAVAIVDCGATPVAGKMVCLLRSGKISYAKYLGDGVAELLNPSFPDRIFKISKNKIIGSVIGHQVSD